MPDRASTIARHASEGASMPNGALAAIASTLPDISPAEHSWTFPGTADQVGKARQVMTAALGDCPAEDEIVLCLSELTSNAVEHSASARPGGTFNVRTKIISGAGVFLEVSDDGGLWVPGGDDDERMHGLDIVRSLAASMSIGGNSATGWVVAAWFGWNPTAGPGRD